MNVQQLWATPLFESKITDQVCVQSRDAVMALRDIEIANPKGQHGDPAGSWVTRDNLQLLPEFFPLVEQINEFVENCLNFLTVKRESFYISCMWSNVSPVGVAHLDHIHANAFYSGLVYLKVPPGAAGTFFKDPRPAAQWFKPDYEHPSQYIIGQDLVQIPNEGKMLFWPAWLSHGVENAAYCDDLRITLSFNIMLRAEFNIHTTKLDTRNL